MIRSTLKRTWSVMQNILSNHLYDLAYVVEAEDWSIKQDGVAIIHALNTEHLLRARITYSSIGIRGQIIHFGSINTFFKKKNWHRLHRSNTVIVTWFHVVPDDPKLKWIRDAQRDIHRIHTSCESTKARLIEAGVDHNKIIVIPLGVDLKQFTLVTKKKRAVIRAYLGISDDRLVIGSFQKDGVGWGEGLKPKLIKGPDLFVETLARLKEYHPLVLLTGPARGYVKRELEKQGIEYKHRYLKNFRELPEMYHALDLYLITSRVEGGPKAILEAWASGIPVVSTRVGMVPDIATPEENVLLWEPKDVGSLIDQVERLVCDQTLRKRFVENGYKEVQKYSWQNIAQKYHQCIYENCDRDENDR